MAPTGGIKDTIPPTPLSYYPLNQSTNFKGKEISISFNENIAADKLKQSLLLSPAVEIKYTHLVKKNVLTIKLEKPLDDSTTYTFNFLDGVTDITEKNPVINLILAFSTGDYIDSLNIRGSVKNAITNLSKKDTKVALYPATDSLDIFKHKPKYIVSADNETGEFAFTNIKAAKYKIIAFQDENKNQQFESAKEEHGFVSDTINLVQDLDSLQIRTVLQDINPLKYISSRPFGRNFDIRFNKEITSYQLNAIDTAIQFIPSVLNTEKNTIRVINEGLIANNDSLQIRISIRDTIQQNYSDTLYLKFTESSKKPDEFKIVSSNDNTLINNDWNPYFRFNKPIKHVDLSKIIVKLDSNNYFPLKDSTKYKLDEKKLMLNVNTFISWHKISDTIHYYKIKNLPDSVDRTDSTKLPSYSKQNLINIEFQKGAIISYENDTLASKTITVRKADDKLLGKLYIRIKTEEESFRLELLSKDGQIERSIWNQKSVVFNQLKPGTYSIRVYIDKNKDGLWSSGNVLKNIQPEPVYNYPLMTEIKANWEIDINDVTF